MLRAEPLGVGAGNFEKNIGNYYFYEEQRWRDAHNTYVRCWGELGVHGFIVYMLVVGSALWTLRRVQKKTREMPAVDGARMWWMSYGVMMGLLIYLFSGLTVTSLYVEGIWWFLALPVCLIRANENVLIAETKTVSSKKSSVGKRNVPSPAV